MAKGYLLGYDLGSSSVKSAIIGAYSHHNENYGHMLGVSISDPYYYFGDFTFYGPTYNYFDSFYYFKSTTYDWDLNGSLDYFTSSIGIYESTQKVWNDIKNFLTPVSNSDYIVAFNWFRFTEKPKLKLYIKTDYIALAPAVYESHIEQFLSILRHSITTANSFESLRSKPISDEKADGKIIQKFDWLLGRSQIQIIQDRRVRPPPDT
jgi:hypothetical protein